MKYTVLDIIPSNEKFTGKRVISGEDVKTDEDFATLKRLNVKYVISLQMGYLDIVSAKKRNQEAIDCLQNGIIPIHIMMSDFSCPTFEQLKTVLDFIKECKGSVYFHCRRGKDRTGMVRAMYRCCFQGWTLFQAKREMNDLGHARFPYFWWQNKLDGYVQRYGPRTRK